jgi:hypothetical protein
LNSESPGLLHRSRGQPPQKVLVRRHEQHP